MTFLSTREELQDFFLHGRRGWVFIEDELFTPQQGTGGRRIFFCPEEGTHWAMGFMLAKDGTPRLDSVQALRKVHREVIKYFTWAED